MARRTLLAAALVGGLFGWSACSVPGVPSPGGPGKGPATGSPKAKKKPKKKASPSDPGPDKDFPEPHPNFARHFTDPIYHDEGDEFAPFGSDEGIGRAARLDRSDAPS